MNHIFGHCNDNQFMSYYMYYGRWTALLTFFGEHVHLFGAGIEKGLHTFDK